MRSICSIIYVVVFILSVQRCLAAEVVVTGTAPGYEGRKLAIVALADEFSGKREMLAFTDVGADANFRVAFDIADTRRVYVHIQRIEAALYVQPGKQYRCVFPQVTRNDFKRFDRTEVELELLDLQESDLNMAIRRLNRDYSKFISEHFYDFASQEYRGSTQYLETLDERKLKIDLFAKRNTIDSLQLQPTGSFNRLVRQFDDSISHVYAEVSDTSFFGIYRHYTVAELYLLSGIKRSDFYERYFMSIRLPLHNPAFISCFKLFYRNMLTGRKAEIQSRIAKAINIERNLNMLADVFAADSTALSGLIRSIACLNGLKEIYYTKSFDRTAIDILLKNVNAPDSVVNIIATNMLFQFKRCAKGELMPELQLINESQDRWAIAEYKGMPVYLYFFAGWSPTSVKELQILERWKEKYNGRMEFVAVCMDDDYRDFRKYLEEHPKQALAFVFGNADPFLQEKINLKAVPYQMLVDSEGKVAMDFCPPPSDPGFESVLNRMANAPDNKTQKPKTWKDR